MKFLLGSRPGSVVIRAIHTGQVRFQFVKDIYKVIGYQAPFNEEEKQDCLKKINNLPEKELWNYTSKKVSKLINFHKEKNGPFDRVEQLLDLPKFEKNNLVKLCGSLLEDVSLKTLDEKMVEGINKIIKPLFSKGLVPKPEMKVISSLENPTFVGVSVTLQGIGYTKMDSKRNLDDWSILPAVENPTSQSAFQHRKLFSLASEIVDSLPQGNFYLFEELLPILPKDPYMKHKVNLIKLRTALMTILMMSKQHNSVGVHTVKPNVLDALFQLKVGNERISMQDSLDRIISTTTTDGNPFTVQISAESWKKYNECNNQGKEYLSGSLHKCLAFNYLCSEAEDGFQ